MIEVSNSPHIDISILYCFFLEEEKKNI